MRFLGVAEAKAKFSECLEQSQAEPVVILSHGKPAAILVGMQGLSLEEATEGKALQSLLAERAKERAVPWKEARARLTAKPKKPTKKRGAVNS